MEHRENPRLAILLQAAGFDFRKAVDCWVNTAEGRAISRSAVDAHDEASLMEWIKTPWTAPR